jgi:hypothetical protein
MTKSCPAHGDFEFMLDPSAAFWRDCQQPPGTVPDIAAYNNVTMLDITNHCQLKCPNCYQDPNNATVDRSLEHVVAEALGSPTPMVCLMGAEPTMRPDLPEIIQAIIAGGKGVTITTNGIRLADPGYAKRLHAAGLRHASVSVHDVDYNGERAHAKALRGLMNAVDLGWRLTHVNFTIVDFDRSLKLAAQQIVALAGVGVRPRHFCIRIAAHIGRQFQDSGPMWMSQAAAAFRALFGAGCQIPDGEGNNPYRIVHRCGDIKIALIRWPTVETIDMRWMNGRGPWASFVPGTIGTGAIQIIMREGMRKGWWQGQRLVPDNPLVSLMDPGREAAALELLS